MKSSWWATDANRFNLVLDFQVEVSGYYKADLLMAQRTESGWIQPYIDDVGIAGFNTLSSDAEPVLRDAPEDLGYVYLEAGVHTLKLALTARYYIIPAKLKLTPAELPADAITLTIGNLTQITAGETVSAEVSALVGKFPMSLAAAELRAESSNAEIVDVGISMDANQNARLNVRGMSAGSATITVTAAIWGQSVTAKADVAVVEGQGGFTVDFTACSSLGHAGLDANTGADHATLATHGWQVNATGSTAAQYMSRAMGPKGMLGVSTKYLQPGEAGREPRWITFDVQVPADGFYRMSVITGLHSLGGATEVLVNGKLVNSYDSYDASITTVDGITLSEPREMGVVMLNKGVSTVQFRLTWRNYIIPSKIIFEPVMEGFSLDFAACAAAGHAADVNHATLEDHGWALDGEATSQSPAELKLGAEGLVMRAGEDARPGRARAAGDPLYSRGDGLL